MKESSQTQRLLTAAMITGAVLGTTGIAGAATVHFKQAPSSAPVARPESDPSSSTATSGTRVVSSTGTMKAKPAVTGKQSATKSNASAAPTVAPQADSSAQGLDDTTPSTAASLKRTGSDAPKSPAAATAKHTATSTANESTTAGAATSAPLASSTTVRHTGESGKDNRPNPSPAKGKDKDTQHGDDNEHEDDDHSEHTSTTRPSTTTTVKGTTTTVAGTTTTAAGTTTTTAPASTTTAPAATAVIGLSQTFTAITIGAPIGMNTTVNNTGGAAANVTLKISVKGAALPHFLEAKGTGWTCSAYFEIPANPSTYTCTGSVAAHSSSVVTVSSGSKISGAIGTAVSATASATPGTATALASAIYN